jgi:hypothetical protein
MKLPASELRGIISGEIKKAAFNAFLIFIYPFPITITYENYKNP